MSRDRLIVVGGGIAGSAAALRAAQYHIKTTWIVGDADTRRHSRGQWVANIDNMIGLHPGIMLRKVLKHLRGEDMTKAREIVEAMDAKISTRDIIDNVIERIRAQHSAYVDIIDEKAIDARKDGDAFVITTPSGTHAAEFVVLATGVMDRQPRIKATRRGKEIDDPKWIYPYANHESVLYCIRCEGHLTAEIPTAMIGSSEAAAQVSMMLYERYGSITSLATNGAAPEWSDETGRLLAEYGIEVHESRIVSLEGRKGQLNAIVLEDGTTLEVAFAFVTLGLYRVYNELAICLGADLTDPGTPEGLRHVRIDKRGETSVPGLFAIGDMTRRDDEGVMKQVYTCQEYAVRAVDAIEGHARRRRRADLLTRLNGEA